MKKDTKEELLCGVYPFATLDSPKYVVICSNYNGKWLLSRHKERVTWETQGGHNRASERILRETIEKGNVKCIL